MRQHRPLAWRRQAQHRFRDDRRRRFCALSFSTAIAPTRPARPARTSSSSRTSTRIVPAVRGAIGGKGARMRDEYGGRLQAFAPARLHPPALRRWWASQCCHPRRVACADRRRQRHIGQPATRSRCPCLSELRPAICSTPPSPGIHCSVAPNLLMAATAVLRQQLAFKYNRGASGRIFQCGQRASAWRCHHCDIRWPAHPGPVRPATRSAAGP